MDIKKLTTQLCAINAVSGNESGNFRALKEAVLPYFDEMRELSYNNYLFIKHGRDNGKKLLLDAHFDQIGMIVKSIDENGFVHFASMGGADVRNMISSKVILHGKNDIIGIITHFKGDYTPLKTDGMIIDCGMSKDKLTKNGIATGTVISFAPNPVELLNDRFVSRSLDDRICGAAICYAVSLVNSDDFVGEIDFLFSCQEETHGSGAMTGTHNINPDMAIAVDVDFALTPELDKKDSAEMCKGPTVSISTNADRKITKKLISVAEDNKIEIQKMLNPKSTGTNANHIAYVLSGVPCAVIGIPIRNMHTTTETVDFSDVYSTGDLIAGFIKATMGGKE